MTGDGLMIFGRHLNRDGTVGDPVGIPSDVWNQHAAIVGETGAGKSMTARTALMSAHQYSDGPTIVIDPKGDGWLEGLARSEYYVAGDLDDVLYFDITDGMPAIPMLDLRQDLAAGLYRQQAAATVADHFTELIGHVAPADSQTVRAEDIIENLILALFDAEHGADVIRLEQILEAATALRDDRVTPAVSDGRLATVLENMETENQRSLDITVQGAITRLEKFYVEMFLHRMFEYAPSDPNEAFRFNDWLGEDVLIMFDLSGPSDTAQQVIANLLLSELWRAIERREAGQSADLPQGLLCIDELPQLNASALFSQLVSQVRAFNFGLIPMMQHPAQLKHDEETVANQNTDAYAELLENVHTLVAGKVTTDDQVTSKFSGSSMSDAEVANRLSNLQQARWFFNPETPRGEGDVRSHYLADPPLPPGHPDGQYPLPDSTEADFQDELAACKEETLAAHGLPHDTTEPAASSTDENSQADLAELFSGGAQTTLPLLTQSLPGNALYESAPHAISCATCGADRPVTISGLLQTLACHSSLSEIEWREIPPVELGVTLAPEAIQTAPVSPRQVAALQLIYNMATDQYRPVEFDLVFSKPQDVLKQFGITNRDIEALEKEGLLTKDVLYKRTYHTVTPDGRDLLNRAHRQSVEWGHGKGDNTETLVHRAMVEALRRYFETQYVEDPASPITEIIPYYQLTEYDYETPLDAGTRFDVVGLDADGRIQAIGEAERANHDVREAAVRDYEQIATIGPTHAHWVSSSRQAGHDAILTPLSDPPDGESRIKSYNEKTRIRDITGLDAPGITAVHTLSELRSELTAPELSTEVL